MEIILRLILDLLARRAIVDIKVWEEILDFLDPEFHSVFLSPVFSAILKRGQLDIIELFCARGMNPFARSGHNTAPPIFGLTKRDSAGPYVSYSSILLSIFDGMQRFYMKELAGSKEYDFSSTDTKYHRNKKWLDTGTLLQRTIAEGNSEFAQFLIEHSNPNVRTAHGWSAAHEAILQRNESVLEQLIMKGADPTETGRRYIKEEEDDDPEGTLTSRKIRMSCWGDEWWDSPDCYDMATMIKKPMDKELCEFRRAYLEMGSLEPVSFSDDLIAKEEPEMEIKKSPEVLSLENYGLHGFNDAQVEKYC